MIITFNKSYYNSVAVKNAIEAYRDLAIFNLREDKSNIVVEVSRLLEADLVDIFEDEFRNFVLSEVKNTL
jgi:hypothetical protein